MKKCFVTATITAKPDHREDLLAAMRANIPLVLAEDGCERYELLVSKDNPNIFLFDEIWESLAALENHSQAPHMHKHRENTAHMLQCPTVVSVWHTPE